MTRPLPPAAADHPEASPRAGDLSIRAQAIASGLWGLSKKMTLTLGNVESRLTPAAAEAMSELIDAGIVDATAGPGPRVEYRLTALGASMRLNKSLAWMEEHGRESLVEPVRP